jgi:hypothetical protein
MRKQTLVVNDIAALRDIKEVNDASAQDIQEVSLL